MGLGKGRACARMQVANLVVSLGSAQVSVCARVLFCVLNLSLNQLNVNAGREFAIRGLLVSSRDIQVLYMYEYLKVLLPAVRSGSC